MEGGFLDGRTKQMHNRNKKGILAFIGLILIVFLITPFIIGQYAKNQVTDIINQISSPFTIRAQILEYHLGWLHSDIKLRIHLENYSQTDLVGDVRIYHGPLLCLNDQFHQRIWYIGPFAAAGDFKIADPELNAALRNELPPEIYLIIRKNFAGDSFVELHTPAVLLGNNDNQISIGGIDLRLKHSFDQQHLQINALFNDIKLDSPKLMSRLDLQYAATNIDLTRNPNNLWSSNSRVQIPEATFYDRLGRAEFHNLVLTNKANPNAADNDFVLSLHADQILMPNQTVGPLDIQASLHDFYDKDLTHFMNIQKSIGEMNLPVDLRAQALDPFVTQLIQGVTANMTSATLKLADGSQISAKANFAFPQINANIRPLPAISQMFAQSFLDFQMLVPAGALRLTQAKATILQATLLSFFQQGWLEKQDDQFKMQIQYGPSGFLMNGKPWMG